MHRRSRRSLAVLLIFLWLAGPLAACRPATQTPDAVTVQLSRPHAAEFVGFYAAEARGYYADEGLVVTLAAGELAENPVHAVMDGQATFGVTSGDRLVRARAEQVDVLAVSTIFQLNPLAVMVVRSVTLRQPRELDRRTIGMESALPDSPGNIQLYTMLERLNMNLERITFVPLHAEDPVTALVTGQVDAISGVLAPDAAVRARAAGHDVLLMFPADYGVLAYPDVIFTSGDVARSNPDLVARFVRATLRGYRYALEHPDEAALWVMNYDAGLDLGVQQAILRAQTPYIDAGLSIGMMEARVWRSTRDMLIERGLLSAPLALETLYTNDFVRSAQ